MKEVPATIPDQISEPRRPGKKIDYIVMRGVDDEVGSAMVIEEHVMTLRVSADERIELLCSLAARDDHRLLKAIPERLQYRCTCETYALGLNRAEYNKSRKLGMLAAHLEFVQVKVMCQFHFGVIRSRSHMRCFHEAFTCAS